ncbi:MAG: hypothetical protein WC518_02545 [Patescibacteria group bacterium]
MNSKISKNLWQKIFLLSLFGFLFLPSVGQAASQKTAVKKMPVAKVFTQADLSGRFLIQKEVLNNLWYGNEADKKRYALRSEADLDFLKQKLAVKVSAKELAGLAAKKGQPSQKTLLNKYKGKIIFTEKKDYWYVNPGDNIRYPVMTFKDFSRIIKVIGWQVNDVTLRKLAMNNEQFTFDSAFPAVAYVKYSDEEFSNGSNSQTILPLASLSKLMTALVFLDQDPDWDKTIEITETEINYPYTLAAKGTTSEVDLRAGDKIRIGDLWNSLLTASSNQSAVVLADNSGLSRSEFVAAMNQKAKDLGLGKTKFFEMSGLDANNISTAEEFAVIARVAFDKKEIVEGTRCSDCVFRAEDASGQEREVAVKNRNLSLLAFEPEAVKTGFLVEAQRNVALKKDNSIVVVLHAFSLNQRNDIIKKLLGDNQKLSYNN